MSCPYDWTGPACDQTLGQATAHQWLVLRWLHVATSVLAFVPAVLLTVRFVKSHRRLLASPRRRVEKEISSLMSVLASVSFVIHLMMSGFYWSADPNRVNGDQFWSSAWERASHYSCIYYSYDWSILFSGFALQALWAITPDQKVRTWRRFKATTACLIMIQGLMLLMIALYDAQDLTWIALQRLYLSTQLLAVVLFAGTSFYGGHVLIRYIRGLPEGSVSETLRHSEGRAKEHRTSFGPPLVIFIGFSLVFATSSLMESLAGWSAVSVYLPLAPEVARIGHIQLLKSLVPTKQSASKPAENKYQQRTRTDRSQSVSQPENDTEA